MSPSSERRRLEARMLPRTTYRDLVRAAKRPEEVPDVHEHIWEAVNEHLGTGAHSLPELVEQLGVMRFGHRPRVADTFAGSGQIPFEAARLGCDVYAADLSPVALHAHMGRISHRRSTAGEAGPPAGVRGQRWPSRVQAQIDRTRGRNRRTWVARQGFLYCLEARCPQTGWMVPLLPTRVVSKGYGVIAELVPDPSHKRYDIVIRSGVSR